MLATVFKKMFGSKNDRELRRMGKLVVEINAQGEALKSVSDDTLRGLTTQMQREFKGGKTLDELLPQAFAVAREAATRVMKMRHFDVQLLGAIALHEGRIAEMRTGEGKP